MLKSVVWLLGVAMGITVQQAANDRQYIDPAGRFQFTYPASFGSTSPGTDVGFRDRRAAIRFSTFSSGGIGGEAALTSGFPLIDIQAVGGLYDEITLGGIFTEPIRSRILRALKPLV